MSRTYTYPSFKSLAPILDLVQVTVAGTHDADDTSIPLDAGEGSKLPAPATHGEFEAMWWLLELGSPYADPNAERVLVTGRSTDTLTVVRGRGNTTASTKSATGTYVLSLVLHTGMIEDIDAALPVNPRSSRFGAVGDGTTDDSDAIEAAIAALPSTGGVMFLPVGEYRITRTLTIDRPLRIIGESRKHSILKATTTGFHMLYFQDSYRIENLRMERTASASGGSWGAVRLDFSFSTARSNTTCEIDGCDIIDFDIPSYVDGGSSRDVDLAIVRNSTLETNSLANGGSGTVQPTVNYNRCLRAVVEHCRLKVSQAGEVNNAYFIGTRHVSFKGNHVTKGVGIKVDSETGEVRRLEIVDNDFEVCSTDILVIGWVNAIRHVRVAGNHSEGCLCGGSELTAVLFSSSTTGVSGPHVIGHVDFVGNNWRNAAKQVLKVTMGAGRQFGTLHCSGNHYYNWSSGSGDEDTYSVVGAGGTGDFDCLLADQEYADGNNNGHSYANTTPWTRFAIQEIVELQTFNTTNTDSIAETELRNLEIRKSITLRAGAKLQVSSADFQSGTGSGTTNHLEIFDDTGASLGFIEVRGSLT